MGKVLEGEKWKQWIKGRLWMSFMSSTDPSPIKAVIVVNNKVTDHIY